MEPSAETLGAAHESEEENAPLTSGQRQGGAAVSSSSAGADGAGGEGGTGDAAEAAPASDDEEAALTTAAPRPEAGKLKGVWQSLDTVSRWRLVLAIAFLGLGLASYVAASSGGTGAKESSAPRHPPAAEALRAGVMKSTPAPTEPLPSLAVGTTVHPLEEADALLRNESHDGADEQQGEEEDEDKDTQMGKDGPSLLCFVWTLRRGSEEERLPEVQKQLGFCEEHIIFTDEDATGSFFPDIMKVGVPQQLQARPEKGWLRTRNMAGLLPAWEYMFENNVFEHHDWAVNVEFDSFFIPSRARVAIASHLDLLRNGSHLDKLSVHGPLMFRWGGTFLFNRKMVKAMKKHWPKLSRIGEANTPASGCPLFMKGTAEWPQNCSQDIVYPYMVNDVLHLPSFGERCGQPSSTSKGQVFLPTCWSTSSAPSVDTDDKSEGQINAIQALASMRNATSPAGAKAHLRGTKLEAMWKSLYLAREVPVIADVKSLNVLQFASNVLGH